MSEILASIQLLSETEKWTALERSLELVHKAASLRARSRKLREASRLIREESPRITREQSVQFEIPQLDKSLTGSLGYSQYRPR